MRDFNQFLAEEGLGDTVKNWVVKKVAGKLGPIKDVIDQAIAAGGTPVDQLKRIIQGIQSQNPQVANQMLSLAGKEMKTESAAAEHMAKVDVALTPLVEEVRAKIEEGLDPELAQLAANERLGQAFGEIGNLMGMMGYGLAGAALLYVLVRFNQPIINTLTTLYGIGKSAVQSVTSKTSDGESDSLKKYKAQKAERAGAMERQRREAALRAQAKRPQ